MGTVCVSITVILKHYNMNRYIFFIIFLSFTAISNAQSKISGGISFSSGYSINKELENELRILQPDFNNSIPIGFGVYAKCEIFDRLYTLLHANLEYNKYVVVYNKIDDSGIFSGSHYLSDSDGLKETFNALALKVPLEVQYQLIGHLVLEGAAGIKVELNKYIYPTISPFWQLGFGSSFNKFSWSIDIGESFQNKGFLLQENIITKMYPGIGAECKNRPISLSLTYRLW